MGRRRGSIFLQYWAARCRRRGVNKPNLHDSRRRVVSHIYIYTVYIYICSFCDKTYIIIPTCRSYFSPNFKLPQKFTLKITIERVIPTQLPVPRLATQTPGSASHTQLHSVQ